jgi:hypothetical protein
MIGTDMCCSAYRFRLLVHDPWRGLVGDVRAAAVYFTSLRLEIPFEIAPSRLSPTGQLGREDFKL